MHRIHNSVGIQLELCMLSRKTPSCGHSIQINLIPVDLTNKSRPCENNFATQKEHLQTYADYTIYILCHVSVHNNRIYFSKFTKMSENKTPEGEG